MEFPSFSSLSDYSISLLITASRAPESYFSLAIIAFGAFELIVSKYYYRVGKMEKRSLDSLIYGGYGLQGFLWVRHLAHQNRSDFCDLRLRCPSRTPEIARFPRQETAMTHCDLRVRWKVASDLRFRDAISEPKTPSFCGISGDLAPSTRKSLAIAIVRFWCAKVRQGKQILGGGRIGSAPSASAPPGQRSSGSNEIIWCHVLVKCALVLGLCLGQCVVSWLAIFVCCLVCHQDRLRAEPPSWGPSDFVWLHVWVLRHWGRLPWWGGLRTPRYHGPLG